MSVAGLCKLSTLADGRYRCELLDRIMPEETKDVWSATQRVTSDLERVIRRHPSRWAINYNLFGAFPTPADLETLSARERRG